MPPAVTADRSHATMDADELDKLLDYDTAVDDFMKDLPANDKTQDNSDKAAVQKDIDEEITIKKKRKPVPKLDEALLLSDRGIPKLRRICKSHLKFRGKGHEFRDMERLLNMYQLWMDDMYPRAKFRDAMVMIEKAGHSKRMQVTRRAWLDDTKPGRSEQSTSRLLVNEVDWETGHELRAGGGPQPNTDKEEIRMHDLPAEGEDNVPKDDDLDELLQQDNPQSHTVPSLISNTKPRIPFLEEDSDDEPGDAPLRIDTANDDGSISSKTKGQETFDYENDVPEMDDLDILLSEQHASQSQQQPAQTNEDDDDDFADEYEAMAQMEAGE